MVKINVYINLINIFDYLLKNEFDSYWIFKNINWIGIVYDL